MDYSETLEKKTDRLEYMILVLLECLQNLYEKDDNLVQTVNFRKLCAHIKKKRQAENLTMEVALGNVRMYRKVEN